MITKVSHMPLFVTDQDEALKHYTQKLGFKLHTDMDLDGMRWLTVCPADQSDFEIVLTKANSPQEQALVGKQAATMPICVVDTQDCRKTFQDLKDRGVEVVSEPEEKPWGTSAIIKDLYGNMINICQP